ncbi:LapA family protein [Paracoccus suum]|uniref:LapA family protein n=1 Tax=Paracoccus suum TaxID=2259340 RepID=A0A344PK57_9RHOB|nr:LapA family protein [Paracoccus suum]AXC49762.1 LapA family protein [Paracoccus suum]
MRVIRMMFLGLLAIALVVLALANRQMVVLRPFPANLDAYLGGSWQVTMPLFLVIFLALLLGMVLGLIWEWLRETQLRAESTRRARDLAELEAEAGARRRPRDDVLALLDRAPAPQSAAQSSVPALPARR